MDTRKVLAQRASGEGAAPRSPRSCAMCFWLRAEYRGSRSGRTTATMEQYPVLDMKGGTREYNVGSGGNFKNGPDCCQMLGQAIQAMCCHRPSPRMKARTQFLGCLRLYTRSARPRNGCQARMQWRAIRLCGAEIARETSASPKSLLATVGIAKAVGMTLEKRRGKIRTVSKDFQTWTTCVGCEFVMFSREAVLEIHAICHHTESRSWKSSLSTSHRAGTPSNFDPAIWPYNLTLSGFTELGWWTIESLLLRAG